MKLSIILPSLRLNKVLRCLKTIRNNSFSNYEIILVGNENIYEAVPIADWFIKDDKCIGTTFAIGLGLEQAIGDYIVTLSDDALVCPHWDDHMINRLEQYKNNLIIGNFDVFDHTGSLNKIGYYGIQFSPFPILKRVTIDKLGLYYSTDFNAFYSDPYLGIKLHQAGGKIINVPEAKIYHVYNPDTLHLKNKEKYWAKDEETFKEKCKDLGNFTGCQNL